MQLGLCRLVIASIVLAGAAAPARAQGGIIDEAKLGVDAHDIAIGDRHRENGVDINTELLFVSPDLLKPFWAPRPHFGIAINTDGNTDYAYAGLTWTKTFAQGLYDAQDGLFASLGLGGAVHDGNLNSGSPGRKEFGSRLLFHEYVEFGYRISQINSISFFLDHMSNANLAKHNAGLTNFGLRYGFGF